MCFRLHPSCPKITRSLRYKRNNNLGVGGEATLYLLTMGDGFVLSAETGDDTAKMCRSMLYLWLQISRSFGISGAPHFLSDQPFHTGLLAPFEASPLLVACLLSCVFAALVKDSIFYSNSTYPTLVSAVSLRITSSIGVLPGAIVYTMIYDGVVLGCARSEQQGGAKVAAPRMLLAYQSIPPWPGVTQMIWPSRRYDLVPKIHP